MGSINSPGINRATISSQIFTYLDSHGLRSIITTQQTAASLFCREYCERATTKNHVKQSMEQTSASWKASLWCGLQDNNLANIRNKIAPRSTILLVSVFFRTNPQSLKETPISIPAPIFNKVRLTSSTVQSSGSFWPVDGPSIFRQPSSSAVNMAREKIPRGRG